MKNPGAESANNFGERTFIFRACLARQFEFRGLFVTVRQKRSSIVSRRIAGDRSATSVGGLFVSTPSTLTTALAVIGFELRFQLIELGLLLRR